MNLVKKTAYLCLLLICALLYIGQAEALAADRAQITDVRVSSTSSKVRIVADADGEVDYESFALKSPDRVVVDLKGASLGKNVERDIEVDSRFVKRVRIGQHTKDTVRIVVESSVKRDNYDVFGITGGSSAYRVAMDFGKVESYGSGSSAGSSAEENSSGSSSASGGAVGSVGDIDVNDPAVRSALKGRIVTIDPGHGGSDTGAIGPSGLYEKTATLAIGLDLAEMLKKSGARVFITRRTDRDVAPQPATDSEELQARCNVGNLSKSDIFVSIHLDSFTSPSAAGTTGYYYTGGSDSSRRLAQYVKEGVVSALGTYDRGTKTSNFYVVKNTEMPATLIEVAFVSNPDEEAVLGSKEGQLEAAEGIFRGIVRYFQGS